jgi:hypothetical protein
MENELNRTKVIAFINNTPDGIDYKRVVITTVSNVGKLKGGSALLYDPQRFSGRTWLNGEKYYKIWNMYSKKKLGKVPSFNGDRQEYAHKLWNLMKPIAVKPTEKDLSNHYVDSPVKENKPAVKESKPVKAGVILTDDSIIQATGKEAKSEKNAARHKLYKKVKVKTILSKNSIKLADIKYDIKSGYAEVVG